MLLEVLYIRILYDSEIEVLCVRARVCVCAHRSIRVHVAMCVPVSVSIYNGHLIKRYYYSWEIF